MKYFKLVKVPATRFSLAIIGALVVSSLTASASETSNPPLNLSPRPSKSSPSDLQIFTSGDAAVCSALGPFSGKVSSEVDPAELPDDGSVWRVGSNRWSAAWDKRYSDWIGREVDVEFFLRTNIATDCADAAVVFRIIFARINHLPVYFKNQPESYSHSMNSWSQLPTVKDWDPANWIQSLRSDQRFQAFLKAVTDDLGTKNITDSTYPVRLRSPQNPKLLSNYVTPGTIVLGGGHTRTIFRVDSTAYIPIEQLDSTVPAQVRTLHRGPVQMWGMPDAALQDGVIRFKWVVNCGGDTGFTHVPAEKMPGFSQEQYHLREEFGGGIDFNAFLVKLVPGKRKPMDHTYVNLELKSIQSLLDRRIEAVQTAIQMRSTNVDAFKDPQVRDDFSTEHRDLGIARAYTYLDGRLSLEARDYLASQARKILIVIDVGKSTNLYYFVKAVFAKAASSDPSADATWRWGYDFLETQLRMLDQDNARLANVTVPKERSELDWVDRAKYALGELKLPAERKIIQNQAEIQLLRKLIGFR
ncbi:MAG: hypothetical protein H7222_01845 [Methylotenera sp.]|nr:hypothetical protein [Oligoflexia bacterium]